MQCDEAYITISMEEAFTSITGSESVWKIDSGANRHFSGSLSEFQQLKRWRTHRKVRVASNTFALAEGYGDIVVAGLTLHDVWYVPDFGATKLISIGQLADEGIETMLGKTFARGYKDDEMVFSGTRNGGLYVLDTQSDIQLDTTQAQAYVVAPTANPTLPEKESLGSQPSKKETDADLWHRRLGHLNYAYIKKLSDNIGYKLKEIKINQKPKGENSCAACMAGRMKEHFSKKTDRRTDIPIRRLHADISGILPRSIRGYRYFLLVVDDATRTCWIRLLIDKSALTIQPVIRALKTTLETQGKEKNRVVVYWRTDNGKGEFGPEFLRWVQDSGMTSEASPAYKHSLNGVVERYMYEMGKICRSILFDARMPEEMWCYAMEWATRLKNRRPTSALPFKGIKGLTPVEGYRGQAERLDKIRVFGSVAIPLYPKEKHQGKLVQRTIPGAWIMVGMTSSSTYKLLNVETFKELISADVTFDEYSTFRVVVERTVENLKRPVERPVDGAKRAATATKIADRAAERTVEKSTDRAVESQRSVDGAKKAATERVGNTLGASDQRLPKLIQETQETVEQLQETTSRYGRKQKRKQFFEEAASRNLTRREAFAGAVIARAMEFPMALISLEGEPIRPLEVVTVTEAMRDNPREWKESILQELKGLRDSGTYRICFGKPPRGKLISSRLVLRNKLTNNTIARRKARLVVRGFEQVYGLDYFDTFAGVIRHTTLRVLLAFAAKRDLEIEHIDIDTAFLNAPLKEDTYMAIPDDEVPEIWRELHPELIGKEKSGIYLKLQRALYGLKQAPREWWLLVKDEMEKLGLTAADADPNLFISTNNGRRAYVLVFVDDMLIIGEKSDYEHLKKKLLGKWKGKDLKAVDTFIGLQIERDRNARTLRIHQTQYTEKILERFGMASANGTKLPTKAGTVLKTSAKDEGVVLLSNEEKSLYQQIVGSLIYLANLTRPDICYIVGQLARHMAEPIKEHLQEAKSALRYLRRTTTDGITYGKDGGGYCGSSKDDVFDVWTDGELHEEIFDVWTDATWGTEVDRKSFQSCIARWNGGSIFHSATRQRSTALSSLDSELMAASDGAREAAWLLKLWKDLDITLPRSPTLYLDNTGAESLSKERKFHPKAKHIDIRHFYIRDDMVAQGKMVVRHVPGKDNMADALTKALPSDILERYKKYMGMQGISEK